MTLTPRQSKLNGTTKLGDLKITHGGETYRLIQSKTLVGRSRRCTIVLDSHLASREHCVIERSGSSILLIELGSKNGTWVNEERVNQRRELVPGDKIRIGSDHLEVIQGAATAGYRRPHAETQRMSRAPSEDTSTTNVDHSSVLDLAEVLMETAGGSEQRPQTTRVILAAIDELLDQAGLAQPYLLPSEQERLRAIGDRVCSWWSDGSLDTWRTTLESRLAKAGRPLL